MADLRPVIRVLFDEAHQEAWTVRPEVAAQMQPTHPADASYARAADLLRARRADVVVNEDAPLEDRMLSERRRRRHRAPVRPEVGGDDRRRRARR